MKKIFIISLILVFIILVGLISYNFFISKPPYPPIPEVEKPKEVQETQKITPPKILYNLSGPIQKIEKDSIIFLAIITQFDETGQPIEKTETRKAIITPFTKFSQLTFVEIEPGRKTPKETQISFKDLKVGDFVEVISNQDISRAEEFEAIQVRILPR